MSEATCGALKAAESALFARIPLDHPSPTPILLLGAPRTGSTLLYQLLVNSLDPAYISNFINTHTPAHPLVGSVIDAKANPREFVSLASRYGKTNGVHGPSEGSAVMREWFGGEHPSATHSVELLTDREQHLRQSIAGIECLTGRQVLIKNAWNCFRVPTWLRVFPDAFIVWIKRDVRNAALSDLMSRYKHGGGHVWNSATPANYREIQKLPPWQQVVEQQFEYDRAITEALTAAQCERAISVWYEDLCQDPQTCIGSIIEFFRQHANRPATRNYAIPSISLPSQQNYSEEERARIHDYVGANVDRLQSIIYPASAP